MRTLSWLLIIAVCFVSGGAACIPKRAPSPFPAAPQVLSETPSAAEVTAAINRTSAMRILSTNSATVEVLSMPMLPKLSNATLSLQRDKRFRLNASIPLLIGSGLDMGSNDEVFWFEVPNKMSRVLYWAKHEEYRQQLNRAILPVDPTWIMDALGLVQINPATIVAGPVRRTDGRLEIRSALNMPDGVYQRVCMIDPSAGYVTHQFLYAPGGNLVATSEASNHRYYESENCALPHTVKIHLQPAAGPPLSMKIDIGSYAVNQLLSGDPQIFTMPQTAAEAVDLTKMNGMIPSETVVPTSYTTGRLGPMPLRGTVRR